ncbi:Malic acid transport-like protein [Cladobotryum mycophilum]|uniref:Malic acid transport-like protein n=1 Tax=Cladobotryum mycophilum TaxID=491253 RepID=A0ABR0SZ13_9HYPO
MAPHQPHTMVDGSITPNCGYESPNEDNQPPFFFGPSPTASGAVTPTTTSAGPGRITIARPTLPSRHSQLTFHISGRRSLPPSRPPSPQTRSSIMDMVAQSEKLNRAACVSIKDRIACYQWTYFTMTMATGGIANVLHGLSYKASWITGVGVFFCLLNIILFVTNCILLSARFYLRPGSLTKSFTDQVESLFIPAFFVSIAVISINICQYGVPHCGAWLLRTMEIIFWIYLSLSAIASSGLYLILWSTLIFPVHMMTPTWVFPAYPLLLTAPFASNLIGSAKRAGLGISQNAAAIAFSAVTAQGTGVLIALMISAAFLYRLMTQKLPRAVQRPGVFISIGPFAFTAAGIAQLGNQAGDFLPDNFLGTQYAVDIIKIISLLVALWFWGLAMWFFLVSVGSLWKYVRTGRGMPFQMTWWSFVFPNTALVTAIEIMGNILESPGIQLFGCIMTIILIIVWIGVFITMIRCLKERKLLWPKSNA